MTKEPSVGIVILNWNGKEDTAECISSLKSMDYKNYEIIVVDNGSTDDSAEYLKQKHLEVRVVENKHNEGFSKGTNIGIGYALPKHDYILVLNNDTLVEKKFLGNLIKTAEEDSAIGIVGPKVYFYNTQRIQTIGGKVNLWKGETSHIVKDTSQPYEVEYLPATALLIKKDVLKKVGFFNANFFLYYEDTDMCMRVKKEGYKVIVEPSAIIWHKGGASAEKNRVSMLTNNAKSRFIFESIYGTNSQKISSLMYYLMFRFPVYCMSVVIRDKSISGVKKMLGTIPKAIKILFFNKAQDISLSNKEQNN